MPSSAPIVFFSLPPPLLLLLLQFLCDYSHLLLRLLYGARLHQDSTVGSAMQDTCLFGVVLA